MSSLRIELGQGFRASFMTRHSEWMLALSMMLGGWVFLLPFDIYDRSPFWWAMRAWVSEDVLGSVLIILGVTRAVVLGMNGAFRPLYHFQMLFAVLGMLLWLTLCFAMMGSGEIGFWVAIFPVFTLAEIVNALRAAGDAGRNDVRVAKMKAARAEMVQGQPGHAR